MSFADMRCADRLSVRLALRVMLCVVPCSCTETPQEPDETPSGPIAVTCATARRGSIADQVELNGVIHAAPEREIVISPRVAGVLLELRVHEGDRVTKGQVLALVDGPTLAATGAEAQAAAVAAQTAYDNARAALERAQRLFAQGIAAKREMDEAQSAAASASAEREAARTRQALVLRERQRASVTTPLSGVVVRVYRAPGDLVDGTSQTPLLEVADPASLELRTDAPAAALLRLRQDAPAEVRIDALPEAVLSGRILSLPPAVDPQTGMGRVRVAIDPSELQLKIGLSGRANVQIALRPLVTLVPAAAVRRSSAGADEVVVCVQEGGSSKAEVRTLELGVRHADEVEVRDGLRPGELVVIDHALNLESGVSLDVRLTTAASTSALSPAELAPHAIRAPEP